MRNRVSTNRLLEKLKAAHGDPQGEAPPEPELELEPLPPIPNKSIDTAHMFFPNITPAINRVEVIQRAVLSYYPNLRMADIKSQRRDAKVVRPRQIAMYLSKVLTMKSLPDIGRRFGGRDHTTVLHAINKVAGLIETDPAVAAEVNAIKDFLGESA